MFLEAGVPTNVVGGPAGKMTLKEAAKKWEVAADAAEVAAEVAASELNAAVASAVAAAEAPAAEPEVAAETKSGPPYVKVQIVRL